MNIENLNPSKFPSALIGCLDRLVRIDATESEIMQMVIDEAPLVAVPRYWRYKAYEVYRFYLDSSGVLKTHERGINESAIRDTDYYSNDEVDHE
jgi:hypothetical protein